LQETVSMSFATPSLIDAARSVLIVVDIQERLCPVMTDPRGVLFNGARLVRGARRLGVPVVVTEQYPKGLGPTMHDILSELGDGASSAVIEKTHFSAAAEPLVRQHLESLGRRQAVICGIEAHVCVTQTAIDLRAAGWEVFVVSDACSSRRPESLTAALTRFPAAGVVPVITEMVLFEWLADKNNDGFKDIMSLVR
ncbi:hydrolase, partial [Rhodospirillum rubrum]